MEQTEYNWKLILLVALPVSAIVGITYYISPNKILKWAALIIGAIAAASITYAYDKKKGNVFTAPAIVFLTALIVTALKKLGWF